MIHSGQIFWFTKHNSKIKTLVYYSKEKDSRYVGAVGYADKPYAEKYNALLLSEGPEMSVNYIY